MPRHINLNRDVTAAVVLGLAALFGNFLASQLASDQLYIPIGNIFLFISAQALGLQGALISFCMGVIPDSFLTGRYAEVVRLLFLAGLLGYSSQKHPRIPGFGVALAAWLTFFAPVQFYLNSVSGPQSSPGAEYVFFTGLCDVLLVMISGVLLLNSASWTLITRRPRHVPATGLIIHVVTSISTLAMFGALSVVMGSTSLSHATFFANANLSGLMAVLLLGITVPALLSWRLSLILSNNFQEFFSANLLSGTANRSFSGLSSEFWRRKSSPAIPMPHERLSSVSTEAVAQSGAENASKQLAAPDQGLCALNRNGTITFMNRRFRKFCEVTSNEVIGKNIASIGMNQAICKRLLQILEETFLKGPRTCEIKVNQLPEKLRFYEVHSQRSDILENSTLSGGPDSIIITVKDITDRRTVEAHLLQAQKLESLGTLVEGIAHTFNNSLTTITGQASFAKRCKDKKQIEKSLNEILKTAFNAGAVVRQLLDFASGKPGLVRPEKLSKTIEDRFDLLKRIAGENCEIVLEKPEVPLWVSCDNNLIMQAVTNLVLNAREAYPSGSGKITISIDTENMDEDVSELHPGTRPGNFARLRIRDAGQGMSPDVLSKAFDPLFTTKASSGHTGLGLSIVFAIVRAHDGFLTAESHPEKGTTVSIYLPLLDAVDKPESDSQAKSTSEIDFNSPEVKGNRENILVVEDETSIRELVTEMLTNLGYKVTSCSDGQEALDKTSHQDFDLILVDMVIPKIRGLELVSKLREAGSCVKALLMTGYGNTIDLNDKSTRVIHKPFDIDTLAKAVKSSLRRET